MSFYDSASLVFLPSSGAGKDTKAYSIKPRDGSGDFTFSRGSNLTSTRIDSNGLIEKGRENLLTYSNDFSNVAWTPFNASVTSGQSGYDGSNDAYLLNITTSSNSSLYRSISMSGVYTTSVYAKANSVDYLGLRDYSLSGAGNWFNLSNGTIASTTSNCIDAKIESVGNGWYRCSITQNRNATGYTQIGASDNPSTTSGTSGSIYIQDAQLELGLVATEYIESGATTGLAGILEDSPRFDYSGGASCPSLLLEPSRTNLLNQSEYFEDFKLGSVTLTTNAITSPEGVQNASLVVCPSGRLGQNVSLTNGTDYVVSVFAKQKGNTFNIRAADGTNPNVEFNLATQTTTDTNGAVGSIEDVGNGWYRCIMKFTASATGSFEIRYVLITDANGVYAYGAQVEQGSYPSSYMPNHSGGSVTRNAEDATLEYSDSFNDITIFAEVNSEDVIRDSSQQNIQIGNDFSQGGAFFLRRSSSSSPKRFVAFFKNNDNSDVFSSYELTEDDSKVAFKYNSTSNACKLFVDGSEVRSATATDITEFDSFKLNGDGGKFNSKQLVVFNTELSDVDCEILTGTSYESFAVMATALNYTTYE